MGDNGDEWEFERIGTEREKMQVEREIQEIRERLAKVEDLKSRHAEIERELANVWVDGADAPLETPSYAEAAKEEPVAETERDAAVESEKQDVVAEEDKDDSIVSPSYADVTKEEAEGEGCDEDESVDDRFEESVEELIRDGDESVEAL